MARVGAALTRSLFLLIWPFRQRRRRRRSAMDENKKRFLAEQANIFKALGHPSRLIMAEALTRGPLCVCDLHKLVGGDLSTVSRHLAVMKEAGVVDDEKRGTNVFYSLSLDCLDTFLRCTGDVVRTRLLTRLKGVMPDRSGTA